MAPPRPALVHGGRRPPPKPVALHPKQELLLETASEGDLPLFKRVATMLASERGTVTDAVESVVQCTAGPASGTPSANLLAQFSCESPLAYAINGAHVATVMYLLDHGADPDKVDDKGFTSLHIAAEEGYCKIVEILLCKGASVDALSNRGTPHHYTLRLLMGTIKP